MLLRYVLPNDESKEFELGEKSVTIGRGSDVDVQIPDKMISRVHCGISFWDDSYFIRDFKSRNGTFVNDRQVDVAHLNPGDKIRVGDSILTVEAQSRKGAETVLMEVQDEMARGKGYHTILQEIIREEEKR